MNTHTHKNTVGMNATCQRMAEKYEMRYSKISIMHWDWCKFDHESKSWIATETLDLAIATLKKNIALAKNESVRIKKFVEDETNIYKAEAIEFSYLVRGKIMNMEQTLLTFATIKHLVENGSMRIMSKRWDLYNLNEI